VDYRSIMSGRRRDPVAMLVRLGLACASIPYRIGVLLRNRAFDTGRAEIHRAGVPVISVGNLTTGGTGKTPVVAYLARWLRERNLRVAIVSRGYGRGESDENDEAAELHQRLPDVPHVQDADRVEAARIAVEELETQCIVIDDGFQHRRLYRDLDVVLIDATCPFGYGRLLPRGLLREPVAGIGRADAVILTRCDQVSVDELDAIRDRVRRLHAQLPLLECVHRPAALIQAGGNRQPVDILMGKPIAIFSGIGNPQAFRQSLENLGGRVVAARELPDHAVYDRDTVRDLIVWLEGLGASDPPPQAVLCTQKDLVKLQTDRLGGMPLYALQIEAEFEDFGVLAEQLETLVASLSSRTESC
jgi:tetraacyldisaccharide 4'-kinase